MALAICLLRVTWPATLGHILLWEYLALAGTAKPLPAMFMFSLVLPALQHHEVISYSAHTVHPVPLDTRIPLQHTQANLCSRALPLYDPTVLNHISIYWRILLLMDAWGCFQSLHIMSQVATTWRKETAVIYQLCFPQLIPAKKVDSLKSSKTNKWFTILRYTF